MRRRERRRQPSVAAPVEVRVDRRGTTPLADYVCGRCGFQYRYALRGEITGECPVHDGAPHEYLLCPIDRLPICVTHVQGYAKDDEMLRGGPGHAPRT